MGRPCKYNCEEEINEANRQKTKRYYERNIETQRIKGRIKYYNKCLMNESLTEDKRNKYNLMIFEAQQKLKTF